MKSVLQYVLLGSFGTLLAVAAPCARDCHGNVSPVCGQDGLTYASACLAECQKVKIAYAEPCSHRSDSFFVSDSQPIPLDVMGRFETENFKLIGRSPCGEYDPERASARTAADVEKFGSKPAPKPKKQDLHELRYTPDGYVYAGYTKLDAVGIEAPGFDGPDANLGEGAQDTERILKTTVDDIAADGSALGNSGDEGKQKDEKDGPTAGSRRLLTVFPPDSRTQITSVSWPHTKAGRLLFKVGTTSYLCSGSMISERTVLTAGHCVFDRASQQWSTQGTYSASQLSSTWFPYGTQAWVWKSIFTAYANPATTSYWPYDMAAIRLTDALLGQKTGWFGLQYGTTPYSATFMTSGYPGDKPSGTYWYTSCPVSDSDPSDGQIYHTCDTYGGQSGSPFYYWSSTTGNTIRGVHSWASTNRNGAAEITQYTGPTVFNSWR